MSCKFVEKIVKNVRQIGGSGFTTQTYECSLKKQSPMMQMEVYDALFKKGYEASFVTNVCPVAEIQKWSECPFFKRREL